MAWRDRLLPASFRGADFFIQSHESDVGGRRAHVHEYPGRDEPYAEDLGLVTKEYEFEAYVVGEDYIAARDRVSNACTMSGPAQLVHPYLGNRFALCLRCRVMEKTDEGGMARFKLKFVDAGINRYPAARASSTSAVNNAVADSRVAMTDQFTSRFQV